MSTTPPIACICLTLFLFQNLGAREIRVPAEHPTIQAAIDDAGSGDTVLVSAGTYRERIRLAPGVTLRSIGDDQTRASLTVIDGGGGDIDAPGVTMAEGATLDGFTVTNVGHYDEVKWKTNWDEQGGRQSHEDIGGFGVPAIAIRGITCTVIHNDVHHNGDVGIAIQGVEGRLCAPLIAENRCHRNMGGGIGSMEGSTAVITGNTCFENFFAGIGHDNASPLVTRNVCYGNIRAGIGISEGASPVVRENRCYQNRRAGIGIRTGANTRPVVENNDCYENEMAGIGIEEEAQPIVRGNRCYRNQLAGIGIQTGARPIIHGNESYENKAAGIGCESAFPLLMDNRVEKNETSGIGIDGDSTALVIGNHCEGNRLVAFGMPSGGEAVLLGNTFVRSDGMPPIVALLQGARATLIENSIQGGGVGGIMLDGRMEAFRNTIEGKGGGSGVVVQEKGEATLMGNRISGYRKEVSDPGKVTIIGEGK